MRKVILTLIVAVLCISLCSCSSTSTIQGNTEIQTSETISTEEKTVDLADQMSITDYTCVISETFRYYVMFVKNDSEECVSVEANIVAKNETGENVSAYSESVYAIAPGQTSCIWTTFDEWEIIKSFDYTLTVEKELSEKSVFNDLTIEYNTTDNKVIATATNNGNTAANFVWFDVVFLKDGEMVGFGEISLMNDNSELPPGRSITNEAECYSENGFDEIVTALNGRK